MGKIDHKQDCVICNKSFSGFGNNPEPVKELKDGKCCDKCNSLVIEYRVYIVNLQKSYQTLATAELQRLLDLNKKPTKLKIVK